MGMFDFIKCEMDLPEIGRSSEYEFQTKDLDCTLTTYTITKSGRLHDTDGMEVPFHGCICFYGDKPGDDVMVEFEALFNRGKLICLDKTDD